MESLAKFLPLFAAAVGLWEITNGVLHDIFVIRQHKTGYDRDLLRLLMDGHVLITCGIMHLISWQLIQNLNRWGYWLCAAACISMLVYIAMIWPFLKSVITLLLNAILLAIVALSIL